MEFFFFFLLIINGGSKVGTVHLLVSKNERDKQAEEKKLECGRVGTLGVNRVMNIGHHPSGFITYSSGTYT